MKRRVAEWFRSDQAVLVALGTHAGLGALLLGWESFISHEGRFFVPAFWPPVFLAAFVASVVYHTNRSSRFWWKASGALLFLAYLSRAATIAISANQKGWTTALAFGVATWLTVALIVEVLWVRVVYPRRRNGSR